MSGQREPDFGPWWKSSYSNGGDNCVEIALTTDGRVGLRHSRDAGVGPLVFPRAEWAAFVTSARQRRVSSAELS